MVRQHEQHQLLQQQHTKENYQVEHKEAIAVAQRYVEQLEVQKQLEFQQGATAAQVFDESTTQKKATALLAAREAVHNYQHQQQQSKRQQQQDAKTFARQYEELQFNKMKTVQDEAEQIAYRLEEHEVHKLTRNKQHAEAVMAMWRDRLNRTSESERKKIADMTLKLEEQKTREHQRQEQTKAVLEQKLQDLENKTNGLAMQ